MKLVNNYRWNLRAIIVIAAIAVQAVSLARAIDIAPMTWKTHTVTGKTYQEPDRSGWLNVLDYGADPTGATDSTAAIQAALNVLNGNYQDQLHKTVYFPAGTYKISATLKTTVTNYTLVGCGINTIIQWASTAPLGAAMIWPDSSINCRYIGLVWDGNNRAGCAFEEYSDQGTYMTAIRHENESFRNFTVNGTYPVPDPNGVYPSGYPPSAIISGFSGNTLGEVTIFNCRFYNCTDAVYNPVEQFQNYEWCIDGCEFDNNYIGFGGGINASGGADFMLMNSHFQGSTFADIGYAYGVHAQRLTSSGSAQFVNGVPSGADYRDCWVDGWTNPAAAMQFYYGNQVTIVDCTFTNPPTGASPPIYTIENTGNLMSLFLSNNTAPNFPSGSGIVTSYGGPPLIDVVPAGSMGGNITSASETFLQSAAIADSTHILDVTSSTYNPTGANPADGLMAFDWTSVIQSAITAAKTANNGSIVYIPGGFYKITSTLAVSGGNYTIEGEGIATQLCWKGASNATMITVSNPQTITIRQLQLAFQDTLSGVASITETATGTSKAVYDNVICNEFDAGNPGASWFNGNAPGLVFNSLPAGSTVYIPVMSSPLTVNDCGQAQIFSKMAYMGAVNVSGATHPKTGFLGLAAAEGGQNNGSLYNFTITDNQNLLVGPYYSEQGANDVSLSRGAGTTTGHVAIQGIQATPTPISTTVNVNNYAGRLFYGDAFLTGGNGSTTVLVNQTGTNPIDMMFAGDFFNGGGLPTFNLGTGANLIATLNQYGIGGQSDNLMTDTPNPLTAANYASLASAMDDFRQLGALNLAVQYGIVNPSGLVAYWKLDETAGPSADSSMSGITGTWTNSPTSSTAVPGSMPYADPGCITLNGTNQYVSMGNPAALPTGTGARTICGWAKSTSTATGMRIIASFGTAATSKAMYIGMSGTSLVGGGDANDLTVTSFWDTNWHFIALTYDGTTAKLYADGVLKTSAAKSWNLTHSACDIGALVNATDFWKGSVDDVRIYNKALTATQISNLFTQVAGKVINVQFTDGGDLPVLNGQAWSSTVSPLAYTGTTWTQTYNYGNITGTNLPYSDNTASAVGFTLTGVSQLATNNQWAALPMYYETEWSTVNMTLTITGLQNGQPYDIYIPVAFNNGDGSAVTIGTQTLQTTGLESPTFVSGVNYVKFTRITPVSNSIVVTLAPNGTGQNFSTLSGFQITTSP